MAVKQRWPGGYVHRQKDGRDLFIIEKRAQGRRFHISTKCHGLRAAMKHLERFEADPLAYEREASEGRAEAARLYLSAELVTEFREWLLNRDRPTTRGYANDMTNRLAEWAEDLRGRDLRRLDLRELREIVARRRTNRQHRIIAIKILCAWLRTERVLLERREDVTLDLAVPQAVPEKHKRRKAVPVESVRAVLRTLAPVYRDCLTILANTGWHVTELERFARDENAGIAPGRDGVLAVLQVRHKSGATTRTPLHEQGAVDAARRLRERREVPRRLNVTIRSGCEVAGVPPFTLGVIRHSVATWAIEAGTPADVVAEFLGHRSKETTLKFYADVGVPTLPIRLPKMT